MDDNITYEKTRWRFYLGREVTIGKESFIISFFFDEFIASNTIFGIRQSVNQIFYGSVTCDKISQSVVSKIRAEDFVFSPGHRIFKDYIISEEYSMEDKSSFIKKLNLSNLPASGADLCDRLEDYYLSNDMISTSKG